MIELINVLTFIEKKNTNYTNYTAKDFFINFSKDVLYDVFIQTIKTSITPFIIFFIITIGYLIFNNVSKVAKPLILISGVIHISKVIIIPIINCCLFFIYFVLIDSSC